MQKTEEYEWVKTKYNRSSYVHRGTGMIVANIYEEAPSTLGGIPTYTCGNFEFISLGKAIEYVESNIFINQYNLQEL